MTILNEMQNLINDLEAKKLEAEKVELIGSQEFMGKEIPVIEGGFGEGKRCLTDKTVADIHNQPTYEIRRRISDNIRRFKENVDFIDLKKRMGESHTLEKLDLKQQINQRTDTIDTLLSLGYSKQSITQAEHIYLLSERGYAKLIKIMDTDLAWEIHDKLIDEYFSMREQIRQQPQINQDNTKQLNAQARLKNATVREANTYLKIAEMVGIEKYKQIMCTYASKALSGQELIPLPKAERKTYSATEIGEMLGISANKVGSLANKYNLKTEDYGLMVWDKSRYSNKQVETFRYYDTVVEPLKQILDGVIPIIN